VDKAIISLHQVTKHFHQGTRTIPLFNNISATFVQGTTYAIMGVSGTGKSTLLQLLAGLEKPTSGEVLYNNRSLATFTVHEHEQYLHTTIGLVFQSPYLIRELSVVENVMLKGLIAGKERKKCEDEARGLLEQVGLTGYAGRSPSQLSGGEQQRVAVARALMLRPTFLLADEPTAHLDEITRGSIIELIETCGLAWSMGSIVSTHDRYIAQKMAHRFALSDGHLISS
jgi:ABC-type lipoprotein export system ATPase subunit